MSIDTSEEGNDDSGFGSCCEELQEVMSGEDFDPLITLAEDGILYMSVGLIDGDSDDPGMVDHPVFFCPFCGTQLQTAEEVQAKSDELGDEE
ncbi:conserved protein of unknown function [Candidatus Filomicrobium marinum]|uniref:Uncharacterized protein n=2 Tax=Filomicrobium TaxID=119044 RepID=A0A0D6JCE7_9HYPH|nr:MULTISPECIES: hypothetical protein [Filomicrobium]CFX10861.1 conserved protein of unknown function [Candidatus Filomicrobium marinum]CPR17184.1 conserved protein of unknown function [Candidatus Filomicrobium marinum]SDO38422.1 hypothetical protein SAMN04488061_1050 [Filomicrobium insigne]